MCDVPIEDFGAAVDQAIAQELAAFEESYSRVARRMGPESPSKRAFALGRAIAARLRKA